MSIEWLCLVGERSVNDYVAKVCTARKKREGWVWRAPKLHASEDDGGHLLASIQAKPLTPTMDLPRGLREAAPTATQLVTFLVATRDEGEMGTLAEFANGLLLALDGAMFDGEEVRRGIEY